jgi:hypothetical protein
MKNTEINNQNIEKLGNIIYSNFKHYFESKDIIITGSPVYYKLGLSTKDVWGDLDINLHSSVADDIVLELKDFFENIAELKFSKFRLKKIEHMYAMCSTIYGSIDFFKNSWDKDELKRMIEVFPGIFTYHLSKEQMIEGIERCINTFKLTGFDDTKIKNRQKTIQEIRTNPIIY